MSQMRQTSGGGQILLQLRRSPGHEEVQQVRGGELVTGENRSSEKGGSRMLGHHQAPAPESRQGGRGRSCLAGQ